MKRILILFMGLILGCNLSFARSVSCWEEYVPQFETHTNSYMATALSGTTIVSTGQEATGVLFSEYGDFYVFESFRVTKDNLYFFNSTYDGWVLRGAGSSEKWTSGIPSNLRYGNTYGVGFIYHYCIVDEGSSGGGGGGATGSVNFIIKATS